MTISERVLIYLMEHPASPAEIGEALNLSKRTSFPFIIYNWGKWNFSNAEEEGLIKWKHGKWYIKEKKK